MSAPKSNYLTVSEVAAYLRCSERKIWQLLRSGELERCKLATGRTMVPLSSLRALENRAFDPKRGPLGGGK
jgi:excisionase family DNA binding protein